MITWEDGKLFWKKIKKEKLFGSRHFNSNSPTRKSEFFKVTSVTNSYALCCSTGSC